MRLPTLDRVHRQPFRLVAWAYRRAAKEEPPDVAKVYWHRPEVFGFAFGDLLHEVMRGQSDWSVGERELFAAYTSKLNQCPF